MAQPHKGDREQIKVRAAAVVYARLREMAAERGTSVSQLAADFLALAVGHPEAVRELNRDREVLPLAM
jgi:predicted HicB family RNase H-like nuclease